MARASPGMTAALELRKHLDERHEVVVVDPRDHFTFIPSLIWLPFGTRSADDVTFPLAPLYDRKDVRFINESAARVDTDAHTVTTASGQALAYDKLLVAPARDWRSRRSPGSAPRRLTPSRSATSSTPSCARRLGPLPGESGPRGCRHRPGRLVLRRRLRVPVQHPPPDPQGRPGGVAPVTFITAEPYLGHFGLGGVGDSAKRVEGSSSASASRGSPTPSSRRYGTARSSSTAAACCRSRTR